MMTSEIFVYLHLAWDEARNFVDQLELDYFWYDQQGKKLIIGCFMAISGNNISFFNIVNCGNETKGQNGLNGQASSINI